MRSLDKTYFLKILLLDVLLLVTAFIVVYVVDFHNVNSRIIEEYRFYRDTYAFLAGLILGFSGSVLQASLRNPLVDHYVLGIGSTSLFAAYLAIALLGSVDLVLIAVSSLAGGLSGLALSLSLANYLGGGEVAYVLAGVGVASLFSGLSFILSYYILQKQPYAWALLLGSFATPLKEYLPYLVAASFISLIAYLQLARKLNLLLLGDIYSKQLGVDPKTTRLVANLVAGGLSSIVVGFFGTIGFLGLVAPNLARLLFKTSDNRVTVLNSSILSGILLLATDLATRKVLVTKVGEIPAGGVVSAFGGVFFLLILLREVRSIR
jgi:iron complex transport system permease protein